MKKRIICMLSFLIIVSLLQTGCANSGTPEDGKSVVTLARDLDSNNLDPIMTADNCNIWVINMMIEGLVTSSDVVSYEESATIEFIVF